LNLNTVYQRWYAIDFSLLREIWEINSFVQNFTKSTWWELLHFRRPDQCLNQGHPMRLPCAGPVKSQLYCPSEWSDDWQKLDNCTSKLNALQYSSNKSIQCVYFVRRDSGAFLSLQGKSQTHGSRGMQLNLVLRE
jgi:hypothetical protein